MGWLDEISNEKVLAKREKKDEEERVLSLHNSVDHMVTSMLVELGNTLFGRGILFSKFTVKSSRDGYSVGNWFLTGDKGCYHIIVSIQLCTHRSSPYFRIGWSFNDDDIETEDITENSFRRALTICGKSVARKIAE